MFWTKQQKRLTIYYLCNSFFLGCATAAQPLKPMIFHRCCHCHYCCHHCHCCYHCCHRFRAKSNFYRNYSYSEDSKYIHNWVEIYSQLGWNIFKSGLKYSWRSCRSQWAFIFWSRGIQKGIQKEYSQFCWNISWI